MEVAEWFALLCLDMLVLQAKFFERDIEVEIPFDHGTAMGYLELFENL